MPRTILLFFAMVLIATAAVGAAQTTTASPARMIATAGPQNSPDTGDGSQSFQLTPTASGDDGVILPSNDVCYRIRAYIFKRDDDRAPELVGSTTCGPRKPRTKNVGGAKAKSIR